MKIAILILTIFITPTWTATANSLYWGLGNEPRLQAFNCSKVRGTRHIAYNGKNHCTNIDTNVRVQNVSITLLQDTQTSHHEAIRCTLTETKRVSDCGMFSHITPIYHLSHDNKKLPMSHEACRKANEQGLLYTTKNVDEKVLQVGNTYLNYDQIGGSWIDHGKGQCAGGKFWSNGKQLTSAVVNIQWHLSIEKVNLTWRFNDLSVEQERLSLPCHINAKACVTKDATYVWKKPLNFANACPAAKMTSFKGVEITSQSGTLIKSTDGSMVRFHKKHPSRLCGRRVWETEMDRVYMLYTLGNEDMWATARVDLAADMLQEYIADRDDFVLHQARHEIKEEFAKAMQSQCIMDKELGETYPILSGPAAQTRSIWSVKEGMFAKHAAEAYYVFRCEETSVVPRQTELCYDSLPVSGLDQQQLLFLQPMSRLLTKTASVVPCSKALQNTYRARNGKWISSTRSPKYTEEPHSYSITENIKEFDLDAGLLNEHVIDDIAKHQTFEQIASALPSELSHLILNAEDPKQMRTSREMAMIHDNVKKLTSSLFSPITAWIWQQEKWIATVLGLVIAIIVTIIACKLLSISERCTNYQIRKKQHRDLIELNNINPNNLTANAPFENPTWKLS